MEELKPSLTARFASLQCITPETRPQPIFYNVPEDILILVVDHLIAPMTYRQAVAWTPKNGTLSYKDLIATLCHIRTSKRLKALRLSSHRFAYLDRLCAILFRNVYFRASLRGFELLRTTNWSITLQPFARHVEVDSRLILSSTVGDLEARGVKIKRHPNRDAVAQQETAAYMGKSSGSGAAALAATSRAYVTDEYVHLVAELLKSLPKLEAVFLDPLDPVVRPSQPSQSSQTSS